MSEATRPAVRIGLVADPDLPADVAEELASTLPAAMARIDGAHDWQANAHEQPLVGRRVTDEKVLLEAVHERKASEGWDVAIGLTDLPRRSGTRAVVADLDRRSGTALASVPALGAFGLGRRARDVAARLVAELVDDLAHPPVASRGMVVLESAAGSGSPDRLVLPAVRGRWRLFAGMVRANRPWRLVSGLSGALLAAFATSAFGLFSVSLWALADRLGGLRLSLATAISIAAMVGYLIVHHGLWERPKEAVQRRLARLYNLTTVATLTLGILVFYVALFVLMTGTVGFVVDGGLLAQNIGHPVAWSDYLEVSWFITSIATVAGALGSGAEDGDTVRRAAYGARQRARAEQRQGAGDGGASAAEEVS